MTYYKLTTVGGLDFHSGTIQYDNIGQWVHAPDWNPKPKCGGGLHYVTDPLDAFRFGASIPCRVFTVRPGKERVSFDSKHKAAKLRVLSEVSDLDALFGFNYTEAVNPVHPFEVKRRRPEPTKAELEALQRWVSAWALVRASVENSAWASVGNSVADSVGNSAWDSVWDSPWDSVRGSVRGLAAGESAWALVRASVGNSAWAYVGSLFPNVTDWQYVDHEPGVYPFADGAYLWRRGLVPSFDGKLWRLHARPYGRIVWSGELSPLAESVGQE